MQHKKLKQAFKINRRRLTGKCTIKKGRKKKHPHFHLINNWRIFDLCMGTADSWPESLIDHLKQALSQPWEHR